MYTPASLIQPIKPEHTEINMDIDWSRNTHLSTKCITLSKESLHQILVIADH